MAVSTEKVNLIVHKAAVYHQLSSSQTAWLERWSKKWMREFNAIREYTERAVTTMTNNAAISVKKGEVNVNEDRLTRGPLTLREGILPTVEVGKSNIGHTRMQVQNFYAGQRNLGLSIRDACRGTEFALNIHDIQVDSTGKTVVHFKETT